MILTVQRKEELAKSDTRRDREEVSKAEVAERNRAEIASMLQEQQDRIDTEDAAKAQWARDEESTKGVRDTASFLPQGCYHAVVDSVNRSPVPLLTASLGNLTACRIGQMECISVRGT